MDNAYQYLEFEHIYSCTFGQGIRSLAITACNAGEGCSTLAMALANRHNAVGKRVLMIDMNVYRPMLNQRFQLERQAWRPEDAALPVIHEIHPHLAIVTAPTGSPMHFRETPLLRATLSQWQQDFDAVIIDTSPLNAINYSNIPAENVCASVDACIMLVLANRTQQADLIKAREKLQKMHANLVGVVMNDLHNPNLKDEMKREAQRLSKPFPRLAHYLTEKIENIGFLRGS